MPALRPRSLNIKLLVKSYSSSVKEIVIALRHLPFISRLVPGLHFNWLVPTTDCSAMVEMQSGVTSLFRIPTSCNEVHNFDGLLRATHSFLNKTVTVSPSTFGVEWVTHELGAQIGLRVSSNISHSPVEQ